ncbi:receptor protein kinase-like protein ZAR1 [Selaginella moellendorffii]|uniref:receptor protein kinase-like protein ZAR1 n=1 Tax=Selaginella moellendorffii TaxID=88036 RepID=UPI000D1C9F1A|nr:receptor protein kinase-like protein ZAR1 [Selaginella moellendorffii]|eukprot:XP_024519255.1 receptor protein kinase-like protein ZAR1 [Selaginella moellendorffii]
MVAVWWLAAAAVLVLLVEHALALNSDGLSLVAFKRGIFSDPERALSDWDESDATPCRWSGISCTSIRGESEPRVQGVMLAKKQLVGSMSPDLGSLSYLEHLNLRQNQLIGGLPPALFNASALQTLLLSDNDLSGPLPASMCGTAASLDTLDLSGNGFSATIPDSIASCTALHSLVLSGNRLTGGIPLGLSRAPLLRLDLSSNRLTGAIPDDLGGLLQLQGTLNLSDNNLSGPIPPSLGRLPISLSIDLSFNNLSGPIPLNGTLSNQGPTAFLGNPGLCGLPLKTKCDDAATTPHGVFGGGGPSGSGPPSTSAGTSTNTNTSTASTRNSGGRLGTKQVVAIAVGDSVGILVIACALTYCLYCRRNGKGSKTSSCNSIGHRCWPCCSCCCCASARGDRSESEDTDNEEGGGNNASMHKHRVVGSESGELVHFDQESEKQFDLDALLRASAYVLGKGSSGIVYKAVMDGGLTVVVRRLGAEGEFGAGVDATTSNPASKKVVKEFESEVKAIGSLCHPNVVALRAYYWGMNEKLLVYDFMPNGSLAAAMEQHQQHWIRLQDSTQHQQQQAAISAADDEWLLSWPQRLSIAKDVARGLSFLHDGTAARMRNIHGNLKPSNILLDANRAARIADFGVVRLTEILACHDTLSSSTSSLRSDVAPGNRSSRSNVDVPTAVDQHLDVGPSCGGSSSSLSLYSATASIYRPPEAAHPNSRPTHKWDVYSFGVIVMEMLTGSASAHLASSDVDMVLAVRRMLLSSSSKYSVASFDGDPLLKPPAAPHGGVDSSNSASSTSSSNANATGSSSSSNNMTTTMLMAGIRAEAEAMELLQLALRCVSSSPEQRPKMKHVVESLSKVGTT